MRAVWAALDRPGPVLAMIVGYCLLHLVVRLLVSPIYSLDEAEQIQFAQTLSLGYRLRQPPLMTWLSWAVLEATGQSATAFFVLKYALMAGGFVAYFAAARRLIGAVRPAALATIGTTGFYAVGWLAHADLTHTVLMTLFLSLALWAALRVVQEGRPPDYLLLGVVVGLGVLTKYLFVVFAVAAVAAVFSVPAYRQTLSRPWSVVAALVAVAIAAPYGVWFLRRFDEALAVGAGTTGAGAFEVAATLSAYGVAVAEFLLPWSALALLLLWPGLPGLWQRADADHASARRFLVVLIAAGLAVFAVAFLLAGATEIRQRWMHPALLWLPILAALALRLRPPRVWRLQTYGGALAVLAMVVVAFRFVHFYGWEAASCNDCRQHAPFPALAAQIEAAGFSRGTLVVDTHFVGGNLRATLGPDVRVVQADYPLDIFPPPTGDGDCLAVWRDLGGNAAVADLPDAIAATLLDTLAVGAGALAAATPGRAAAPMLQADHRVYALATLRIPGGAGGCH